MEASTKSKTSKAGKAAAALIWSVLLILPFAYAAENLAGQAFSDSGNFAIGANVTMNDTSTGETYTHIAGTPLGQYSVVMQNATSGHNASVFAWNDTHVGYNTGTFGSSTLTVNVTINITWEEWNNTPTAMYIVSSVYTNSSNYAAPYNITFNDTTVDEAYKYGTNLSGATWQIEFMNGSLGDTITVMAFNGTHVGYRYDVVTINGTRLDVDLNMTWLIYNQSMNASNNETQEQEVQTMDTGTVLFHFGSMIIALILFIASFVIVRTLFMFLAGVSLLIVASIIWTLSGALSAVFLALGIYTFARAIFE